MLRVFVPLLAAGLLWNANALLCQHCGQDTKTTGSAMQGEAKAMARKVPSSRNHEGHAHLQCGNVDYDLSIVSLTASESNAPQDGDIAISFKAQPINCFLSLTIKNLSTRSVVLRWGSLKSANQHFAGEDFIESLQAYQLEYSPFTGGTMKQLETNMRLAPSESVSVYVTSVLSSFGEGTTINLDLNPQILPSDLKEAQRVMGKRLRLTLPMLINGKKEDHSNEFLVNEVSATK